MFERVGGSILEDEKKCQLIAFISVSAVECDNSSIKTSVIAFFMASVPSKAA